VKVLPPDINLSQENFLLEDVVSHDPKIIFPKGGIRTALKQVAGLSSATRDRIYHEQPFTSFFDFVLRVAPARDELEQLIFCGAFEFKHSNRRALLWAVPIAIDYGRSYRDSNGSLPFLIPEPPLSFDMEDFNAAEKAIFERRILGMDIEQHLMSFERDRVRGRGGLTAEEASCHRPGLQILVVGNPIRLRFPPTQSGRRVMFFDLEDETGMLNVTCFDEVYQRDGHKVICNPYIALMGETQDRDGHLSFLAHKIYPYKPILERESQDPLPLPVAISDFLMA
jgi:error-prone DNA polymerase